MISTAKIASPEPLASAGRARWRVILDGEPASLDSPRFEAVTGALQLVVPPGCGLVRTAASANA